ncbi:MAG: acyl-CoA dehydrogenase, partial [Comamonadaceae bacterium]
RDARVTMIYEGSNEIQAIDLLVRKVLPDGALAFNGWLTELGTELDPAAPAQARLLARLSSLREHTRRLLQAAAQDDTLAYWVAEDFLRAVGLALVDWAWVQIAGGSDAEAPRWKAPAQAVQRWIMPELDMRLAIIDAALTQFN